MKELDRELVQEAATADPPAQKPKKKKRRKWDINEKTLVVLASLGLIWLGVFCYAPMFGAALAFKDADMRLDVWDALFTSEWVGFYNFREFFIDPNFAPVFWNTLGLNTISLLINFPAPILFALLINEMRLKKVRSAVQTVANFPHFISWTVFGGMIIALCDMTTGIINPILNAFGLSSNENPVNLLSADYFWTIAILSSLLKGVGISVRAAAAAGGVCGAARGSVPWSICLCADGRPAVFGAGRGSGRQDVCAQPGHGGAAVYGGKGIRFRRL